MKLLFVNDNIVTQELFRKTFPEEEGFVLQFVERMIDVKQAISSFVPDIVIIDTEMAGYASHDPLNDIDKSSNIKIILLSKEKVRYVNPLITAVITKPFSVTDLKKAVDRSNKPKSFFSSITSKFEKNESGEFFEPNVKFGKSYVVYEKKPDTVYKLASVFRKTSDVLLFTTKKDSELSDYFTEKIEIVRVSSRNRDGYTYISKLGAISNMMNDFVQKHQEPVLVFDCINEMIGINGSNSTITLINDVIKKKHMTVLVSIDKNKIDDEVKMKFSKFMVEY